MKCRWGQLPPKKMLPGKICFKCKALKALDEFYPHPAMKDGHLNKCKECTKKDVNTRYVIAIVKIREYEKLRFQTPERKAKVLLYQRRRRHKYPEKTKARTMVNRAIRRGKIIRQPCEICGQIAQAHHEDYSKPLDVKWLCFEHHRIAHGQQPALTP